MHLALSSAFLLTIPLLSRASNDWRTPCVGSCAYEAGDGEKSAWGSIILDGSPQVISDISDAAGWSIMDCDSTSQDTQVIRLVCHDSDAGCEQLFDGGAENTIVRLPEECADAPFARVASITSSTDQTLTEKVARKVEKKRKRASEPEVMTVTIDYNFHLIPESRGTVSLTALATTNPLQRPLATAQRLRRALGYGDDGRLNARSASGPSELVAREVLRRNLFSDFIGGNKIPPGTTVNTLNATTTSESFKAAKLGHWDHDWNKEFNVLDIKQQFPMVDAGISCPQSGDIPAFDARLKIDADVDVQATVTVGFIIAGTILPPSISKAAFTSALEGEANVAFDISAVARGTFNTGLLPLYSSGIAGLSIPGILDVGPIFSINGQGIGQVGVATDAVVSASYKFPGLSMVYPQEEGESTGQASQSEQQNPLSLSIGGSASLTGSVSAHIIPRVELGVKVLSGMASASVFLQLDGYGSLDMDLSMESSTTLVGARETSAIDSESSVSATDMPTTTITTDASTSTMSADSSLASDEAITTTTAIDEESTTTITDEETTTIVAKEEATNSPTPGPTLEEKIGWTDTEALAPDSTTIPMNNEFATPSHNDLTPLPSSAPDAPSQVCSNSRLQRRRQRRRDLIIHQGRDASIEYSGCIGMKMGVKIGAGAEGKLLSFWKASKTFEIWGHEWSLFEKCFQTNGRRSLPQYHGPAISSISPLALPERALIDSLVCPVVSDTVQDTISADNQII